MGGINHHFKTIFIHNPRSGGSSVEIALGMFHTHDTMQEARARQGEQAWASYFRFSLVRDPLTRLISTYEFARMERSWYHDNTNTGPTGAHGDAHVDYETVKRKSLEDCCRMLLADPASLKQPGWLPQSHFISDPAGLDFVGRYENLTADWRSVCKKLSVEIELPRINETGRLKDRSEYYTPFVCAFAASYYKADYAAFGYGLPLPFVPDASPEPMTPAKVAHGVVGIAKAVTGTGGASEEMVRQRTTICSTCEHAEMVAGVLRRCKKCGCATWPKIRNASESCPAGRWTFEPTSRLP